MKTFMKIGEFLANPIVTGILLTVIIIPAFWGLIKLLEWIKILGLRSKKNSMVGKNN